MFLKNNMKFLFGCLFGAAFIMIVGFSAGWFVTGGNAHATATAMSEQAVKDQLVPICMHQFRNLPDSQDKLKSMLGLTQWEREGFIRDQGSATMPGSESSVAGIARACAAQLAKIAS